MKTGVLACLCVLLCLLSAAPAWVAGQDDLAGDWLGTLTVPQGTLRVVFHLAVDERGGYAGTLDVPEQAAKGLPLTTVALTANVGVHIVVDLIRGDFTGRMTADRKSIAGSWRQGETELPLTLARMAGPLAGLPRPQDPKPPFPYAVEEIAYPNPDAAGVTLAGALTLPKGKGPFPAVLLISGSGPEDRDEMVFGHRPFLVIADYLTRRGIAVLRVDDRGVGKSTGDAASATLDTTAGDVLAGLRYLKTRREIDPARLGLVGHSEGGIVAPLVAAAAPADVAFLVLLAAPGIPGDQLLVLQTERIGRAGGIDETTLAGNVALVRQLVDIVKREPDAAKAETAIRAALDAAVAKLPEEQRAALARANEYVDGQVRQFLSPAMRAFLACDPALALAKVTCPVLALNGALDMQVPCRENLAGLLAGLAPALRNGGTAAVTLVALPGLNHLFQTCKTGSPGEYALIQETCAPAALQTLGDWIVRQTEKGK